jgi:capsular polysaccharide transport system permease protein
MFLKISQRLAGISGLFLITVIVPTLLALVYFGLIASDEYVSESRFVVRAPERQSSTSLGMFLRGAAFNKAQDESYSVQDYILSRDALQILNEKIAIGAAYKNPAIDRLSRFAGIDPDDSFEALHRYYQKKVSVQTDAASSITTLVVRGFTSESARDANRILLEQSEALVNRLNERGRQDMIKFASAEVVAAEKEARSAALALSTYRNAQGVVDPERQASVQLQQIAKLQEELIVTTTQLAQLVAYTPNNPQIPALRTRANTLRSEVAKETSKVTGGQTSLANKAADYQRVALDAEIANKQLGIALASLENARNEAQRKQIYLERIAQPSLPDVAQEPRRLRSIVATLLLGLVAWGILTMLMAGVREHLD